MSSSLPTKLCVERAMRGIPHKQKNSDPATRAMRWQQGSRTLLVHVNRVMIAARHSVNPVCLG